MAKLLVLSDTHGQIDNIRQISHLFDRCDYVFHLGDYYVDMNAFTDLIGDKLYRVKGNCDFGGEPIFLTIDGVKIMAVHGNKYHVKSSLTALSIKAREENCQLVLFGHTHYAEVIEYNGVTFVNPGNMTAFSHPTYAIVDVTNGKIQAKIESVNKNDEGI